jgi:sec-independent protein translocase protein TatB
MFGMGTQEILVILAVALIFIGPKRLPEIARALGRGFGELRRAADEIKGQIDLETMMEGMGEDREVPSTKRDLDSLFEQTEPSEETSPVETPNDLSQSHEQEKEKVPPKTETG